MFFNINYLSFLPHKTNYKLLYVVLGLHNVLDCVKNIGDCDHTCIIHLEVGKQVMNHSLICKQDQATYEHALLNTRWTKNDKTVNPFSTRSMPLRRPESEIF